MNNNSRIFALIVAAGSGVRAGAGTPKQYRTVGGKPMLRHSVQALASHPAIAGVQVVIHPSHADDYTKAVDGMALLPVVHGGAERADSVRAGLAALAPHTPDYVLIHDAARPFLSHAIIDAIIQKLSPDHAVIPALAVVDTVRRLEGNGWSEVSRDGLFRVQTPQAFPFEALKNMAATNATPTDEAALWLAAGHQLVYVEGDENLRKVTTVADMAWTEEKIRLTCKVRSVVGMGYDVHALVPAGDAGVIRLGGIDIAHSHKLLGHSDADVVLHAVVDALLGALAEGDIGAHFPPSDARWKGADSKVFIEEARSRVAARGGVIQHLDITIIGERPKISPQRDAMRTAIAGMLRLPLTRVSVKATTSEKLGFTGREEGLACQAVATLTLPEDA